VAGSPLAADFDGDGDVDGADLAKWKSDFDSKATSDADADGDSDGHDFLAWQRQAGAAATGANAAVPEPGSAVLVAVAAGLGMTAVRRRRASLASGGERRRAREGSKSPCRIPRRTSE
jgi:hypothetical protein